MLPRNITKTCAGRGALCHVLALGSWALGSWLMALVCRPLLPHAAHAAPRCPTHAAHGAPGALSPPSARPRPCWQHLSSAASSPDLEGMIIEQWSSNSQGWDNLHRTHSSAHTARPRSARGPVSQKLSSNIGSGAVSDTSHAAAGADALKDMRLHMRCYCHSSVSAAAALHLLRCWKSATASTPRRYRHSPHPQQRAPATPAPASAPASPPSPPARLLAAHLSLEGLHLRVARGPSPSGPAA